ncbi:MAG TPA: hypothetical protein DIW31_08265 [Bacteroidales bacterium]|nr:hypothetical protein [Bacteroidales bacterium]
MNNWYGQFMIMFGGIMTLFYIGVGLYFILSPNLIHIDSFIRYLLGGVFIFYGIYRAFRVFEKIKEVFSSNNEQND